MNRGLSSPRLPAEVREQRPVILRRRGRSGGNVQGPHPFIWARLGLQERPLRELDKAFSGTKSWSRPLDAPTYAYKYVCTRVGRPGLSHIRLPQLMTHQSAWGHFLTSFSLLTLLLTLSSGTSLLVLWLRQPFKAGDAFIFFIFLIFLGGMHF